MYKDLAGREFRDQRSRQYPSRSRSFGKVRNKKKKKPVDDSEEEPSAAMMIQQVYALLLPWSSGSAKSIMRVAGQMLAQKTNPMLVSMLGPTAASMGGTAAMAPGVGLSGVFNTAAPEPEEEPSKVQLKCSAVSVARRQGCAAVLHSCSY